VSTTYWVVVAQAVANVVLALWVARERVERRRLVELGQAQGAHAEFLADALRKMQDKPVRIETGMPVLFPCGCSTNKVMLGLCDLYAANGALPDAGRPSHDSGGAGDLAAQGHEPPLSPSGRSRGVPTTSGLARPSPAAAEVAPCAAAAGAAEGTEGGGR
jgi:hypothetical protein